MRCSRAIVVLSLFASPITSAQQASFVNWESPHVHPIDLTPNGARLLVANTADCRLEVFAVVGTTLLPEFSVPVGLDPVSVRARTNNEVWVVNHVSDSVSVVKLNMRAVTATIATGDEPADVVFAGSPQRAFVTVSQLNQVRVYDPADLTAPPVVIEIEGEDPRGLATDGTSVYAAIFESGNGTTVIGSLTVSDPAVNPYKDTPNPPPNSGSGFDPPQAPGNPDPPQVGQIVKRTPGGQWLDDNGADWSAAVTWDVHGHDIAIIDAATLAVSYANDLMNIVMAISIKPNGDVHVVGTEAMNDVRFEPNLQGVFGRVVASGFAAGRGRTFGVVDLNAHLDYTPGQPALPGAERALALGDPRGIAWVNNMRALVTGMGSNNVGIFSAAGARLNVIDVGEGPTGIVVNPSAPVAYVLNRFEGSVSIIGKFTPVEFDRIAFYDPTPAVVRDGRRHLFDTHATSALGHLSCASCHVDGRMDQIAWDLGDPQGAVAPFDQQCTDPGNCPDFHPMKGPMSTQTLQGIIGTEPLHWRGDRASLAEFNPAFVSLLGRAAPLTALEMDQLEAYVATIRFPPNPFRTNDGALSGEPFPNGGNAVTGSDTFSTAGCVSCHALPDGTSSQVMVPIPIVGVFQSMKIPQLRNLYEKTGFENGNLANNRGFGFTHDGSVHTLDDFLQSPTFSLGPVARRNLEAFLLSFSMDTHAGVGVQSTVNGTDPAAVALRDQMLAVADAGGAALILKSRYLGKQRGAYYLGNGVFQTDEAATTTTVAELDAIVSPVGPTTYTLVPIGTEVRLGVDRDEDGHFDHDEIVAGSDPSDPASVPGG